jgi:homoaconitase/3-isopropylmalate dehydratase large subunit
MGGRTFLAWPQTAAASAMNGVVSDPRTLPGIESLAAVGGR